MKHLNQNQEFRFNEILFEHRNREYGAYVLRNESDRILTKALFVGVSLLAAISITPLVISAFKTAPVTEHTGSSDPRIIKVVETPEVKPPVQQVKPQPTQPEKIKTFDKRLPEPTANVRNEKETVDEHNAVASTQTSDGKEVTIQKYQPVIPDAIGKGTVPYIKPEPPVEKVDKNKIVDAGDLGKEADFTGGINSFRNKVMSDFDGSGFDSGDVMKTTITFIVEIDGTISGIKANGVDTDFNSEAIRTIKAISKNGKWIPGKNKQGESVRSYFKFPISMKFDN